MSITATKKKKDGLVVYRVRVRVKQPDGSLQQFERRVVGLQEAKRAEQEMLGEQPTGMTVSELATLYSQSRVGENRRTTIEKADRILRCHVFPTFGDTPVDALSVPALQKWKADIGRSGLALVTRQGIFTAFSALLNFGVKCELVEKNNLRVLGNFRDSGEAVVDEKLRFYTPEQFSAFISALPSASYPQKRIHAFFMVAYFTGCRKGEINALKWSDLDGDVMHVRRSVTQTLKGVSCAETAPKNKSSIRNIRIPSVLAEYLKGWKAEQRKMPGFSEDWRLCGGHDIIHDSKLFEAKRKAAALAGVPEIAIHDFRHSHATLLINNGVNIKEISRRLGHSSVEMTWNVYSHLYPSQEEKALAVLDSVGKMWAKCGQAF